MESDKDLDLKEKEKKFPETLCQEWDEVRKMILKRGHRKRRRENGTINGAG